MERSDERLSTRDIASGGAPDPEPGRDPEADRDTEPEREAAPAEPVDSAPADSDAVRDERTDRDFAQQAADDGAIAAGDTETPQGRGPSPEAVADAEAPTRAYSAVGAQPPAAAAAAEQPRGERDAGADRDATADRGTADGDDAGPLLEGSEEFQARWEEIQVRFVDEPRGAVEDADALVATVMQRLAEGFASEREQLEAQWGRGEDISTEDLRVALQRYRSFFRRLLAT
jgi:hypothetical protein